MPLNSKPIVLLGLVVAVLGLSWICAGKAQAKTEWRLVLRSVSEPPKTWSAPVQVGSMLRIQFVHSWDHIPIKETLMVTDRGDFLLKESEFSKLAVGYDAPPISGDYKLENGEVHITNMDIRMKTIRVRIGTVAQHHLWVNGKDLDLAKLFGKGRSIILQLTSN